MRKKETRAKRENPKRTREKEEKPASPSQAETPSHRKSGYDFSKNYPKTVADGAFFPTEPVSGRFDRRTGLAVAAAAVVVFLLSYILFAAAQDLSDRAPQPQSPQPPVEYMTD